MKVLGIIPARYASTRFEGKPLADIKHKPMIQWVYEAVKTALDHVIVATDDVRIENTVKGFGGEVIMTSTAHETGTNRCLEAYQKYTAQTDVAFDVVINIQGDEPMLKATQINEIISCFKDPSTELATLVFPIKSAEELKAANDVFVVFTKQMNALYFSRSPIPHVRGVDLSEWTEHHQYYKHIGMYAYKPQALQAFAEMEKTDLEKTESLEQNRWLENDRSIKVGITNIQNLSVDTPQDLEEVKKAMQ